MENEGLKQLQFPGWKLPSPGSLFLLLERRKCQVPITFRLPAPRSWAASELLQFANCTREITRCGIQLRQLVMGWSESRIALQGLLKLSESLRIAMRVHQRGRIVCIHDGRERIERQSYMKFLKRLIEFFLGNEKGEGVQIMGPGAVGV